jgi:hypothetical protein
MNFDDRVRIQFVHCGSQPDKLAWGSSRDCSPDSAQVTVNKCVASMPHRSMSSPGISNESGACATVGWSHGLPPQQAGPLQRHALRRWGHEPRSHKDAHGIAGRVQNGHAVVCHRARLHLRFHGSALLARSLFRTQQRERAHWSARGVRFTTRTAAVNVWLRSESVCLKEGKKGVAQ